MYSQASAVDVTASTMTPHEPICDITMTNASSSTILDRSAYPHIYEQIIRAADDTALQLRRVSRQTKKEVDARMAFHHVVWDGEFFFKRSPVFLKMCPLWRQKQIMTGHPPPERGRRERVLDQLVAELPWRYRYRSQSLAPEPADKDGGGEPVPSSFVHQPPIRKGVAIRPKVLDIWPNAVPKHLTAYITTHIPTLRVWPQPSHRHHLES